MTTPTSLEEEDVEYGDKMPQNWFCPHLLSFKVFYGDQVLKPNNATHSAMSEPSAKEDKQKVEGGRRF